MGLRLAVGAATTKDERKPVARAARSLRFAIEERVRLQKYQTFVSQRIKNKKNGRKQMND